MTNTYDRMKAQRAEDGAELRRLRVLIGELVEFMERHTVEGYGDQPEEKLKDTMGSHHYFRISARLELERRALLTKAKEVTQ